MGLDFATFWCTFGLEFHIDFRGAIFACFFEVSDLNFEVILASKIDPGGIRERKARPLILNDSTMKIKVFEYGRVPGGSQNRSREGFQNITHF